jgi:DNA polymerase
MRLKFFDIESYPSFWGIIASDQEDSYDSSPHNNKLNKAEELRIKAKMREYTSDQGREGLMRLKRDMSSGVLTGFNNKRYDQIILNCILAGFTALEVYIASNLVIHRKNPDKYNAFLREYPDGYRIANYIRRKFTGEAYQDLMDDTNNKGLKDHEASLGLDIRETTVPFGQKTLTADEKAQIMFYCRHDVYALHAYYITVSKPYIDTKVSLCKQYDIAERIAYQSTNAVLAGIVLGAEKYPGTTIVDPTITIYQKELREYFEKWIPNELYHHILTSQQAKNMTIFGNRVYTADGGLHSIITTPKVGRSNSCIYVEATESHGMWHVDASSCYPATMIFCNAMPRGITKPQRFVKFYSTRLGLKQKPKSTWTTEEFEFVPSAKLVMNTTFGAAGNKWLALYDDYMRSKICRIGQMILISLANNIYKELGLQIIQSNTDGIIVYGSKDKYDALIRVVQNFERISKFTFEVDEEKKIWQANVNNYLAIDIKDKVTLKGGAFINTVFQPGTNRIRPLGLHVINKAQNEFYINKTNPVKYLLEHTKVADFCLTATKGPSFYTSVQRNVGGDLELGKVSRVVASDNTKYGSIKKLKWSEIKPTATQIRAGKTVDILLAAHRAAGKKLKFENNKWYLHQENTVANCPPHTWIVNDALYNYKIEGPYHDRRLTHIDGSSAKLDFNYYTEKLSNALDRHWYKLKDGKLAYTKEFNL